MPTKISEAEMVALLMVYDTGARLLTDRVKLMIASAATAQEMASAGILDATLSDAARAALTLRQRYHLIEPPRPSRSHGENQPLDIPEG